MTFQYVSTPVTAEQAILVLVLPAAFAPGKDHLGAKAALEGSFGLLCPIMCIMEPRMLRPVDQL